MIFLYIKSVETVFSSYFQRWGSILFGARHKALQSDTGWTTIVPDGNHGQQSTCTVAKYIFFEEKIYRSVACTVCTVGRTSTINITDAHGNARNES